MTETSGSEERTTGVRAYRELLATAHRTASVVEESDVARAELVFNLSRAHARLSADFDALHRERGWSWAGFRLMNVLWAVGEVDMRDLARLSGASRATISSALNALERNGSVRRTRDPRDRRLVTVRLTEEGERALVDGMRVQAAREREWFAVLEPEQVRTLAALLAAVADRQIDRSPN